MRFESLAIGMDAEDTEIFVVSETCCFKLQKPELISTPQRLATFLGHYQIFEAARSQQVILLTKDSDFVDLANRFGAPPQIQHLLPR